MRNAFGWLAILLGSLLGLILAILTAIFLFSSVHLNRTDNMTISRSRNRKKPENFVNY